jgi:hypothetical protein
MKSSFGMGLKTFGWMLAVTFGILAFGNQSHAQRPAERPFENIYRRPSVSPYNQISNVSNNPLLLANAYQQMVVPQQEQQRQRIEQMSQRRDMGRLQNQVQQIQRGTLGRQIDPTIRPTGHASTYMNYSHYYPMGR